MLTRTHTRTHVYVEFANPYLQCGLCLAWLTGWHNPDKCGCDGHVFNQPCGHQAACSSGSWLGSGVADRAWVSMPGQRQRRPKVPPG